VIKARDFWETWEATTILSRPPDFFQNLKLVEAMYEHARALGVFPPADPLEGLETKIRLARVLSVPTTPGEPRPRT
jgi:hypothetical protein